MLGRMARKLRIQFPGAIYLITSRGDRRQPIFQSDADRQGFLVALGEVCSRTGWNVYAWCLMGDHFHLVLATPEPNLIAGMKWLLGTYTARFNRQHKFSGHVFAGRYKSLLVGDEFLPSACDYVHLNPARAGCIPNTAPLHQYSWSSYAALVAAPGLRPDWLKAERLFKACGIADDDDQGRAQFALRTEERRHADLTAEYRGIRRGWCYGGASFREQMLTEVARLAGPNHFGEELNEAAESKARRIIEEELRAALWTEAELLRRKKGDSTKLAIATRLRAETTVTLQWIASQLHMGTKTHLSHLLYWNRRNGESGGSEKEKAKTRLQTTRKETKPESSATPLNPAVQPPEVTSDNTILRSDPFEFDPRFD
jgi:putative transposase